jgi:hypothetical protein
MEVEEIRTLINDASPRATSEFENLQHLADFSNFPSTQMEDITNLLAPQSGIKILSFYEKIKTKTVVKVAIREVTSEARLRS